MGNNSSKTSNCAKVKSVVYAIIKLKTITFLIANRFYKTAPLPKVGEVWKLERTLPSGLLLLHGRISFIDDIKEKIKIKFLGKHDELDLRPYHYDVERFLSEDKRRSVQKPKTISVSWHPTAMLLVTDGERGLTKLWNAETGELLTKHPAYGSQHTGTTISWSYDGNLFAGETYMFDSSNGEPLVRSPRNPFMVDFIPGIGEEYSASCLSQKRGLGNSGYYTSHLSSNNNFSPFRPNHNQYIIDDSVFIHTYFEYAYNPWQPNSDSNSPVYKKPLVLRNPNSGEIEKVIDCDVESQIRDFAWHPKGRFIAVSFDKNNIRIIDIDDAKIVDDMSVQSLVGWSPDGKILVAKQERYKGDFIIWDALETVEKPMPEAMKNELWFKRFFKNINADGSRYFGFGEDYSRNIYSLETDELLFILPKNVTSAAWSPIDGGLLATCGGTETHIWRI